MVCCRDGYAESMDVFFFFLRVWDVVNALRVWGTALLVLLDGALPVLADLICVNVECVLWGMGSWNGI